MVDIKLEIPGERRRHIVRLWLDFGLPQSAPAVSNPDAPGFAEPPEPGFVHIQSAYAVREVSKTVSRERRLTPKMVDGLNNNERFSEWLYKEVVGGMPHD